MVSIYKALEIIANLDLKPKRELIPIESAIGRVAVDNLSATISLPRFNNSAMDGYAIREGSQRELKLQDTILAGEDKVIDIEDGFTIKIMTGARVPDNSYAVIPKENTTIDNNIITFPESIKKFDHIRFIGEDLKAGETILKAGEVITSNSIALLASQGISHIEVYKKVKVSIFATGEELKLHFQSLKGSQIFNSNTPSLFARAKELNTDVNFIGGSRDTLESIKELIENSLDSDIIVTSGGISVGDADFTREAFESFNFNILFDKVDIKPGKPTLLGRIDDTLILNLPGNPFASAINFEIFGRALIYKLSGKNSIHHNFIVAKSKNSITIKKGRNTVIAGYFDGEYFISNSQKSAGMVTAMRDVNSFLITGKERDGIKKNEIVKLIPIEFNFSTENFKEFFLL